MKLQVFIANTNIAFPVLTDKKNYENDDKLLAVCDNEWCSLYGVVQIPKEIMDAGLTPNKSNK